MMSSIDILATRPEIDDESPMPIRSPSSHAWRRLARLTLFAALGTVAYVAVVLGPPWFRVLVPPSSQLHALARLIEAAQSAYIVALMVLPAMIVVQAIALMLLRRRVAPRSWLARALALCAALAIGLAIAEGVSAARLAAMQVPPPRLKDVFPDRPGDRTVDVVILGESSARGDPYHEWLSVGEIVAWKLREAIPGRGFAVENLARPGIALDQVHRRLEALERRPDLVILYAGHNEFSMRHDWSHGASHYVDEAPPERMALVRFIREHSPVCRLIGDTAGLFARASPPKRTAARQLVDVPVYTAAEYAERLHDFRARLEAMTAYGERVGALVVLVIPPGNDADFEPNRSFLPVETPRAEREAFARDFQAARQLESADPDGAIAAYRALLDRQPRFAEAHYRLARLQERAGRREAANRHYVAARDADGLPMRCVSEFLDVYREVADRHPEAILIDGPAVFRGLNPRGVAGDDLFSDGIHPSLIGYTGLAEAILRGLHARRAFGWGEAAPAPTPVVSPSDCARHFGMDPDRWRRVCDYAAGFYYHTAPIRFDPSERQAKQARYAEASRRIQAGIAPDDAGMPGVGTRIVSRARMIATPAVTTSDATSGQNGHQRKPL
jgi:lysophospholipase L1-like esterase